MRIRTPMMICRYNELMFSRLPPLFSVATMSAPISLFSPRP